MAPDDQKNGSKSVAVNGQLLGEFIRNTSRTQAEFARLVGVTRASISNWINEGRISTKRFQELCERFGEDVSRLAISDSEYRSMKARAVTFPSMDFIRELPGLMDQDAAVRLRGVWAMTLDYDAETEIQARPYPDAEFTQCGSLIRVESMSEEHDDVNYLARGFTFSGGDRLHLIYQLHRQSSSATACGTAILQRKANTNRMRYEGKFVGAHTGYDQKVISGKAAIWKLDQ